MGEMLIVTQHGLWEVSSDGAVMLHTRDCAAIGSGAPIAMGAMWSRVYALRLDDIAECGVKAACEFDSACSGLEVLTIDIGGAP